jgi:hypothetical protein
VFITKNNLKILALKEKSNSQIKKSFGTLS